MTRKDYKAIAEALREARDKTTDREAIRHIITELERVLQNDNPRFDNKKFEEAIYGI